MVAIAKADAGSPPNGVTEYAFDDSDEQSTTAEFLVTFPSNTAYADVNTAISSHLTGAATPLVYDTTGGTTGYSMGLVQIYSQINAFNPNSPDEDLARYLAKSCV